MNWRAVVTGFLVEIVAGLFALAMPGVGHAVAGLIGGFVAGYIAGGGLVSGAWHGLVAGSLGGLVLAAAFGLGTTLIGTVGLGPLGPFLGGAVFFVALAIAVLMALDSALAGALGGILGDSGPQNPGRYR
ncbi:DUF5518 domain-containing protein [Halostella sp. JP-L12]|uniref:DUF5518 domain-containing protein n=1 Tax=Halostella TaxID=1843185 RepID=UPI000EF777EC|nr:MULTISPECIES: DUF5518 domain-containing protein [Halostella]NHN48162.1 DUF5518 domain-containing protein [Halostella sp. JP-L12]